MANIKTAISLQKSLFEQVETLAREMKVSRSRLFVLALEDYLRRYENLQLLERINQAYSDAPDATEQKRLRKIRRQHRKVVEGTW
jgi:metal-responsive CopG/Arc/MetJ family transcriptional regulator